MSAVASDRVNHSAVAAAIISLQVCVCVCHPYLLYAIHFELLSLSLLRAMCAMCDVVQRRCPCKITEVHMQDFYHRLLCDVCWLIEKRKFTSIAYVQKLCRLGTIFFPHLHIA